MHDTILLQQGMLEQLNRLFPQDDFTGLESLPTIRNITYAVNGVNGRYVFKMAPADDCGPLLREYKGISEIYSRGGPVPRPYPIMDGADYSVDLNDICYTVRGYEFIQGGAPEVKEDSFFSLGTTIGNLHNVWQPEIRPSYLPEVNPVQFIHDPLDAIAARFPDNRMDTFRRLGQTVVEVLSANKDAELLGVTHGDLHHMNAIQSCAGNMVLIDLEDIGWQWRAYDLATAIWGTFGRGGSAVIWNELINGYSSVRKLDQTEAMLIRFLIFARHLWWLGLYARNWEQWPKRYTLQQFFEPGLELLGMIAKEVCGLDIS